VSFSTNCDEVLLSHNNLVINQQKDW